MSDTNIKPLPQMEGKAIKKDYIMNERSMQACAQIREKANRDGMLNNRMQMHLGQEPS
jgi:hypothetical protein